MVRELGSERRKTVWSLSTIKFKKIKYFALVREDQDKLTNDLKIIF